MKKKFKLFTLLLIISCSIIQAQNVTLNLNNVPIKEVIEAIKTQTKISFFFNVNDVNIREQVSVNVVNEPFGNVLDKILKAQSLTWKLKDNHIIISQKQNKDNRVIGKIIDEKGVPLIGVNIVVNNTNGTISDIDGDYSIKALPNETITFTYIGYLPQVIKVKNKSVINVTMLEDLKILDEVVVIGYGTQKKANLTGAVGYVDSKSIENRPVSNLGQAIQGALPNVNVSFGSGKPGENTGINIRGYASINQESKPLILIDGIEGSIDNLNPRDVESISVLKDASSSAIYGARAPFGVILVTTKKGKTGKAQINYSGRFSTSKETTKTNFITSGYDAAMLVDEFMTSYNGNKYTKYTDDDYKELEARRYDKIENPERPWTVVQNRGGVDTYMHYGNFDWYNYLIDSSRPSWDNSLSISGGSDKVKYMVSGNYNTQKGIYVQNPDRYKTANLRASISAEATKWLTLNFNTALFSSEYAAPGLRKGDNIPNYTFHAMPFLMPYNPDGTHVFSTPIISQQPTDGVHIMTKDGNTKSVEKKVQVSYTVGAVMKILKGLTFNTNYSFKYNTIDYMERTAMSQFSTTPGVLEDASGLFKNKLRQLDEKVYYHTMDAYFNYDKSFRGNNFRMIAGFNYEQNFYKRVYATKLNIQSDILNDFNLGEIGKDVTLEGGQTQWALLGYFGRFGYDYKGKYLAEVNLRWDASSRFPKKNRAGLFPSLSAGWRASEEKFFEPIKDVFSNLKIRGSIGALGNQAVTDCYPYLQQLSMKSLNGYLIDGEGVTYAALTPPPAGNLTWETIIHQNIGLDLGFFRNRLNFSGDLFIRDTKDMLIDGKVLPAVYGVKSPRENAADLRTSGFEMVVSWNDKFILLNKPFNYNLSLSLADSRSFITKYDNPLKEFSKGYYEGMEIGEIWGYKVSGLFKTNEDAKAYQEKIDHTYVCKNILETATGKYKGLQAGDIIFEDVDGSGRIDDGKKTANDRGDMRIIGNSRPRYSYSANLGFDWYGVDVSAFIQGVGLQNRYPGGDAMLFWGGFARPYASFTPEHFTDDVWSETNPDAYFPRLRGYAAQGDRSLAKVNTRYLQNLAYCRLKNLTVGYTLPSEWMSKIKINRIRLYFSGDNLLTFTALRSDYVDPEQFSSDGNARVYPFAKTFSFGLDITF